MADPPYNIGKDFGNNTDRMPLEDYVDWCNDWLSESIRILKPSGTMFIFDYSEILAYLSVKIPIKKRWLIWHYTNKNVSGGSFWQRSHEAIVCAWKDTPIFNVDDIREPYTKTFLRASGKVKTDTGEIFKKWERDPICCP
jgi:site-specific DNA-methyltransferase (adenine-specific)